MQCWKAAQSYKSMSEPISPQNTSPSIFSVSSAGSKTLHHCFHEQICCFEASLKEQDYVQCKNMPHHLKCSGK